MRGKQINKIKYEIQHKVFVRSEARLLFFFELHFFFILRSPLAPLFNICLFPFYLFYYSKRYNVVLTNTGRILNLSLWKKKRKWKRKESVRPRHFHTSPFPSTRRFISIRIIKKSEKFCKSTHVSYSSWCTKWRFFRRDGTLNPWTNSKILRKKIQLVPLFSPVPEVAPFELVKRIIQCPKEFFSGVQSMDHLSKAGTEI